MSISEFKNPYVQYMYSYPHKTAYRALDGVSIENYMHFLCEEKNSLYFHIPFCQYKCGYCNLFSLAGQPEKKIEQYIDAVERQAEQWSELLPSGVEFADMTLGGGTPLLLSEKLLRRVFRIARDYFGFRRGRAIVVETSPNQTTPEKLALLKEEGVTRLSMGVQSFQPDELKSLYRFHEVTTVRRVLEDIRKADFDCVNLDLIYGISGQTKESLEDSLKKAVSYQPDELFVYPLYIKPDTYLYRNHVRNADNTYALQLHAREALRRAGYRAHSMRRYVRGAEEPADVSCGFDNTLALGCGGRSYLGNLHFCTPYAVAQEMCGAILKDYIGTKDYRTLTNGFLLSPEEQKRRYLIRQLLYGKGILRTDYRERFGGEPEQDFPALAEWAQEGYAVLGGESVSLSEEGIALSDYLGPKLISEDVRKRMQDLEGKA